MCSKTFFQLITSRLLLCPVLEQECLATFEIPPIVLLTLGPPRHRTDHDTDLRAELQEVLQQNRVLEEHQAAMMRGTAPASPQPMTHGLPNSGLMSPLTIHEPSPRCLQGMHEALGRRQGTEFNSNNSNNAREQLFRQEFRVASPLLGLIQGGASAGLPSISLLQPSEWLSGPWLLRNPYGISY